MGIANLAHLYVVRLKARIVLVQECFAVLGIAIGVALLFASQVADTSLNGSVRQLTSELVGNMQFQLHARSSSGLDERLVRRVSNLPGVEGVLPVLEIQANLRGPSGQQAVDLIGTDPRLVRESSPFLRRFRNPHVANQQALALPTPVANAVGVQALESVEIQIGARDTSVLVGTDLDSPEIGTLVHSPVALAPLSYAQALSGNQGRVSRLFVRAQPAMKRQVHTALLRLAAGRLNVQPADFDASLFKVAAAPANQGQGLFSGISALVGFMFAINAMLLTGHLRRSLIRGLRVNGATRSTVVKALLLDALILGTIASALGLALGDLLSLSVFRSDPGYLSLAFPVGSERIIDWQSVALAIGAGLLAACVGVLSSLTEIVSWPIRSPLRNPKRSRAVRRMLLATAGTACLAVTTIILLASPQSAVLGSVTLVLALLLFLPLLLESMIAAFDHLQRRFGTGASQTAAVELRSPTTRSRSIAIAATGAIAVFGSVSIQGAHSNLQHGLDRLVGQLSTTSDMWVLPAGEENLLATTPFNDSAYPVLRRLAGIASVGRFRASFLDYGDRKLWVLAPPSNAARPIPPSQLVKGSLSIALSRLHHGGWAVVSQALAAEHDLHIGQRFTLPSPRPTTFRVAALTTNLGWPPGAIILNPADYIRAWGAGGPTAYNITLAPGTPFEQARTEVRQALGVSSALVIQSAAERDALQRAASRQGLSRLTEIATLVLIATVLAMSIAMGTMVWQRRPRLARLKAQGFTRGILWRALLWESVVLLGAGCLIGAIFGIYGQLLISHALASVTGFPVILAVGALGAAASSALVSVVAVAIVAVPGHRAASVKPYL
jgi:putative ABC transport system permease protein